MTLEGDSHDTTVAERIGLDGRRPGRRFRWFWLAALAGLGLTLAGTLLMGSQKSDRIGFKTAEVRRGDLTVKVTATGQLQPVIQVDVGTEVSGTIQSVEVDFNARVKRGQVLARLDPDQSQAKERQSAAALELAKAQVDEAQATVNETANKLGRTRDLVAKRLASPEELDTAVAAAERASAALAVARAKVDQARAQLDADRRTLEKTIIRSPIDGIVLNRVVEPGQTVAASLQTPVLFTLAENLTQMELKVAVDEADVGQVAEGQSATFTVDAYPHRTFPATITQVRFAPETVNGVVTFAALLAVDNADLSLRPGMTATADILVREERGLLLVPNLALRFTPPQPKAEQSGPNLVGLLLPRRPPRSKRQTEIGQRNGKEGRVWILRDGEPAPITFKIGLTDGVMTEVLGDPLDPGTPVLVDVERPGRAS
ncbi:efflux RND transporter periplasmic adaptor subunit [Thiocystis violascens]|uniref:RND family efflux transporter, MFP subunit n=1 Tax=Thiocystis violascens (strain ATCC 17096 / DSM 198 / 6111) TaxID=765911 RepID=I3Y744_THIV6|nr:efflux RND transporter periplasmic adaptor subunit [Thiocystis violascens]AFL72812.1 RND family efflux transporter, MFP subunit [Thiocystis violascens DSM 198]